ncbi:E3 ubiquitin-protein ligase TRIM21-like isoform X1 [Acanthochromis polyacanthus]|uniref:E3 ubiquitin-protein ligase TRIM21-like isoform X1 n=1 Tax=Acanthochromis polyacanthus TaxID=80966 RepID=UPI0022342CBE|nr:E3 ubiquitin-protein ligase TRIM21-like isoform X1 [Acanthochromis polyacanthus]
MSAAHKVLTEDHFLCSICLDVFTDPVTTPCGHNFCKNCITDHWNISDICQCPICKKEFKTRPELDINTFISEMVAVFRREAQQETSSSEQQAAEAGEVLCDICTGTKLKALKSCLVCLLSYCETHLELHLTKSVLKRHQLVDPVEDLEDRMCLKHDKPLELFCRTDDTCICLLCSVLDHKTHQVVPLKEEYEEQKAELLKTDAEVQQMIQKRRLKISEIRESLRISNDAADGQKAEGVQVFTALKEIVERRLKQLIKEVEDQQKAAEEQAEDSIQHLEQQISELMKRSSEMKQLSDSEDHLHLLQSFRALKAAAPTEDLMEVTVHSSSYEGTVVRAVAQIEETLTEVMKKIKLKLIKKFAVDVTLDPDTARNDLILSDDGKQVSHGGMKKNLPNNPERFTQWLNVLGKQSFSSSRFYFEVQVKRKTGWDVGVVRESVNRKVQHSLSPQCGFWKIGLMDRVYRASADPYVRLSVLSPYKKVGVFVDYEEGLVSFYDADNADHIYSFTGYAFTEPLYPFLNPHGNNEGKNSAPLIITPVSHTE